jgi:DNA-binding MarR family transcriptional regulator
MLVALLYVVDGADFLYLLNESGMTKGNLSSHLSKLEEAGYIEIVKSFRGKVPHTLVRLTTEGRGAFERYRAQLRSISATLDTGSS